MGATAKFATNGKARAKKDLGAIAMGYRDVYVATVAAGAKDTQSVIALQEAASYEGVSLVVAYAHCIHHGYDMNVGLERQKAAVQAGYWPLYRYDPRKLEAGEAPLKLDSGEASLPLADFMAAENRFAITGKAHPDDYAAMVKSAEEALKARYAKLKSLAPADE
jgi:pyruvate-ferredoxin/flavodoxin oxidoreductase